MTHLKFLIFITFAAIVLADDASEHVLDLTTSNFDDTIKDNDYVLVKFYAPWCGHCKALAPEYETAAKQLKESGSDVKLAKVDATVHTDLATRYKVQGYPTLKFFKKGAELEYNGPRKADGIINWINKKLGPALTEINSASDLESFKSEKQIVAILISNDENADYHKAVGELASKVDSVPFAHIKDDAIAKEAGLSGKLVVLKKFDEPKVEYTGDFKSEDLEKFIKLEQVPLVTEFNQESAQIVFESDIKTHVIAFSGKKGSNYQTHLDMLKEVATPLKGKCHVVVIDMDDAEAQRVGEFFGVKSEDVPTFRVFKMDEEMIKYQPDKKDFTSDYVKSFTLDVLAGKVKPHLKSADEPSDWDSKPVKVLVANTFKQRAVNKDHAVFVEFYAPWCGHCKALAPIWDELGEHYSGKSEIIIAKCDATENEFEDIKISSFPTLKFSPKGSTEFIDYKGERNKEAFIKFIDSNGEISKDEDSEKHDEL